MGQSSSEDAPPIGAAVPSPCVGTCRLDARQLCVGCRRTLGEIAEWPAASEARRREILRGLALRPGEGSDAV